MNTPEAIQEGAGVTFVNRLDPVDLTSQSTLLESEVITVVEWAHQEVKSALTSLLTDPAIYTTPAVEGVIRALFAIQALTEGEQA